MSPSLFEGSFESVLEPSTTVQTELALTVKSQLVSRVEQGVEEAKRGQGREGKGMNELLSDWTLSWEGAIFIVIFLAFHSAGGCGGKHWSPEVRARWIPAEMRRIQVSF